MFKNYKISLNSYHDMILTYKLLKIQSVLSKIILIVKDYAYQSFHEMENLLLYILFA